mgnify:FL=1
MMITQLGLVFLVLVSFEIIKFFNLKKLFKENVDSYKNLIKNFLNNQLDDQTKQQQIIKSSKNLFSISFKIFLCIGLILFLIFLFNYFNNDLFEFLLSVIGIIETIILFVIYSLIRRKKNE